jgi:hypothetical protein
MNRDRILKRGIIAGVVYFRLEERDLNPHSRDTLGRLDLQGPRNWNRLTTALTTYFIARDLDLDRPTDPGSTFLRDVCGLATVIDSLFQAPAPKTAVNVVGRVMRFEGWNARHDRFEPWRADAEKVCAIAAPNTRAVRYLELFERDWEYHHSNFEKFTTVFEDEEIWALGHRNRLAQLGYLNI